MGRKVHTLTMFNSVISSIIEGVNGANLKRKLLAAPALRFNADKGDVVYSVQKLWKFELTMSCHTLLICSWFYSVISFLNCLRSCICVHEQIGHNVHDINFPLMCSTCSETSDKCMPVPLVKTCMFTCSWYTRLHNLQYNFSSYGYCYNDPPYFSLPSFHGVCYRRRLFCIG